MDNNLTLTERPVIWEEKNSIGPEKKLESSGSINPEDITKKIENEFVKNECENTGKKRCTKCNQSKFYCEFNKNSKSKDGFDWYCKTCNNLRSKKYHQKNNILRRKQLLNYYYKNKSNIKSYHQKYVKIYRQKPENKIIRNKQWKFRYENDVCFRIECLLRGRFKQAVFNKYKYTSVINLTGCSIEELRNYLEMKFQKGMNWENQGEWHIDHIMPCSSFDLTKEEEQKKCFHYTNLQPLWKTENLKKGNKLM